MTRLFPTVAAGFTCSMLVAAAHAELPKALDLAPPDAVAAFATSSLTQLNTESMQLMAALGLPPVASPMMLLAMTGLQDSVNMDGSAALVITRADPNAEQPEMFVLLPVKDAAATMQTLGAAPGDDGVGAANLQGETVFIRAVEGGYVALGPRRDVIANMSVKGGNLAKHKAAMGATGDRIASSADIVFLGNVSAMGPIFDKMNEGMQQGMAEAGGGPQAEQAKAVIGAMEQFIATLRRDGRALIGGVDASAAGVGMDMAVTFNEGSESAKLAAKGGDAHSLLNVFPDKPFLFAAAFDSNHPIVRDYSKRFAGVMQAANQGMPGMFGFDMAGLVDKIKGQATVVYPNPAGMMGGVFANLVSFTASDDPKALLAASKEAISKFGVAAGPDMPVTITSSVTPNETQINGVSVDGWSVQMQAANGNPQAMQGMQAMQMLFGQPGGMSGYLAAGKNGVYQTMSKNSALLQEVMTSSGGLAKNASMNQINTELPSGRIAEGYIGIKPIVDMVGPMAQMFIGVPITAPADLPPVGFGAAAADGAVHGAAFIPMPVMKYVMKTAQDLQNMGGGQPGQPQQPQDGNPPPRRF